jgi:hypothetical protein
VEEGVAVCDKEESVPFDMTLTYTADYDASGFAEVNVYVHDSKLHMMLDNAAPPSKCDTSDVGQQCQYKKRFACGCEDGGGGGGGGAPLNTEAPTKVPAILFGTTSPNFTDAPVSLKTSSPASAPFSRPSSGPVDGPACRLALHGARRRSLDKAKVPRLPRFH